MGSVCRTEIRCVWYQCCSWEGTAGQTSSSENLIVPKKLGSEELPTAEVAQLRPQQLTATGSSPLFHKQINESKIKHLARGGSISPPGISLALAFVCLQP